ncbi:aldo/keto reductase [soil metagenome]
MSIPTRPLGSTGVSVSSLCIGGWHVGQLGDEDAIHLLHAAHDEGITFWDNAWDYHEGRSEDLMGRALQGRRDKVFLMTKNCSRDAAGTRQHLEDSLRRLRTDYLDLWQFHEINYDNDPEWIVESGALAEAIKAQKEGKVRFLGFTGHKSPHILQKMIPLHTWDTCQHPVNVCDHHYRSFRHELLPNLAAKNIASIGMKSMGGGNLEKGGQIVANGVVTAEEALRYSLSQPIASLVVGIDSLNVLKQDVAVARNFVPLESEELNAVLAKAKPAAGDGRHEWHKSTQNFDGPYHRQQHGFAV